MNPVTHIEYPRLWSVDITVASGILITPAFCLLSRPERGVCRCLCPCCLPSGTLRIRDSLLFRERSAPASPILFPHRIFVSIAEPAASAMPRLCSVCRCSLADGHSPRCVTCQVSQLADGRLAALTAALGQQTTRHPAAHSVYPAPAPPAPVDITLAFCLKNTLSYTVEHYRTSRKNLPFATLSCEWQVTARSSGSSADGIRCSQLETLLYISCILYAYSAFRRWFSPLKPQGGRGYPYGILGEIPPNPIVKA